MTKSYYSFFIQSWPGKNKLILLLTCLTWHWFFHVPDNYPTINKYQLNAYNSESKGLWQGLNVSSMNNSPSFFSCFEDCWRLTQPPHHSLLPCLENTLPPSRLHLPPNMEALKARHILSQPLLHLELGHVAQPWSLGPEGGGLLRLGWERRKQDKKNMVLFCDQNPFDHRKVASFQPF